VTWQIESSEVDTTTTVEGELIELQADRLPLFVAFASVLTSAAALVVALVK
jgi:hypothetical protein